MSSNSIRLSDRLCCLLSRDNSLILRGVAILFIVLHNFLHLSFIGYSAENEMSFSTLRALAFFNAVSGGSNSLWEFFSHLGWVGVPVFIFLTGYGTALAPLPRDKKQYLRKNYLKLLVLLFPAILFFAALDILRGDWLGLLKRASYLTMLENFAYPFVHCNPGVYWYFSLAFQLYLIWAFGGKFFKGKVLLGLSIAFLIGLFVFSTWGSPQVLSIYRHCFTGWFPVFACGIWLGKKGFDSSLTSDFKSSVWSELLCFVLLLGLIFFLSRWLVTWLFVPIAALAWFLVIGLLLMRSRYLTATFRWTGKLSAFIFVCHPIARFMVLFAVYPYYSNLIFNLLLYITFTIVLSLIYRIAYTWLFSKIII